jgi:hypothetical protein
VYRWQTVPLLDTIAEYRENAESTADRSTGRTELVYWSAFVPAAGKGLIDEIPPEFTEMCTGPPASPATTW